MGQPPMAQLLPICYADKKTPVAIVINKGKKVAPCVETTDIVQYMLNTWEQKLECDKEAGRIK